MNIKTGAQASGDTAWPVRAGRPNLLAPLILLIIYLSVGSAIYLIAYGEPHGFAMSIPVVVILWPLALIWWSLYWIVVVVVLVLACLGLKHLWDGL